MRLVAWFLIVLLVVGGEAGLVLEEATTNSQITTWGYSDVTVEATFLKFSEDLYMSEDLFCLPVLDGPNPATCLPCSYTDNDDEDSCPSHVDPLSSQFSASTQAYLLTLPPCVCSPSACRLSEISQGEVQEVVVEQRRPQILRYEHDSWEQGFVVRKKAITAFSPRVIVSTSPNFESDKIIAESRYDNIQVCPSNPLFGSNANTVTYFIYVQGQSESKVEISIETLPTSESRGEPIAYDPPSPFEFWETNYQDLSEGAYMSFDGMYFYEKYGIPLRHISPMVILYPFSGCGVYSFRTEVTKYNGTVWSPHIFAGVVTQTLIDSMNEFQPGTACLGCFGVAEFLVVSSQTHQVSQDSVLGVCPTSSTEQNFIAIIISSSEGDWSANLFIQNAAYSPYLSSFEIGDRDKWSHVQIQEHLGGLVALSFPCHNNETCDRELPFIQYLARRNLLAPNYFPSLLYPVHPTDREDMVPDISFEINGSFVLRCNDRIHDSACGVLSMYPSGDFATPLVYPALQPLLSLNSLPSFYAQDLSPLFPTKSNRLSFLTFLAVGSTPVISKERYREATMMFANPSRVHTKDLSVSIIDDVKVADLQPEPPSVCSYETFHPLYELMDYFHKVLQASQRGLEYIGMNDLNLDSKTASYWAYALTLTKEWQSCWDNGVSLVNFGVRVTPQENSTACPNGDLTDPCCNPRLRWSQCCSAEGRNFLDYQWLPLSSNEDNLDSNCLDPTCMGTFAEDFREIYRTSIVERICVVNDEIFSNISVIFGGCTSIFIGHQPEFGIPCFKNSQCDFLQDSDGYCDLKAKKCIVDPVDQENGFLQCLIELMGSYTKTLVYEELVKAGSVNPDSSQGEVVLTADMLKDYSVDGETRYFDDYGPLYDCHQYYTLQSQPTSAPSTCPVCSEGEYFTYRCLTVFGCEIPNQCRDSSDTCISSFVLVNTSCPLPSATSPICNWNNTLSSSSSLCLEEEFQCMYCFNSTYCVPLPASSQEECEETPVCVLLDGEVLWGVGGDDCERRMTCSDPAITGEDECLASGDCVDPDLIQESIEALIPSFPEVATALNGVCITPLPPQNIPSCPLLRPSVEGSLDFTSQRGCVRVGSCVYDTIQRTLICAQDPATEEECINEFGGTWLSLPISNSSACENPRGVDDDAYPGFCRLTETDIYLSPKDREPCEECGGEPEPPAWWDGSVWGGGKEEKGKWRKTEMVEPYYAQTSTISYVKLEGLFNRAALNYENFILWTGEACLINPFVEYLDIAACDCAPEKPPSISDSDITIESPFNGFDLESTECREMVESDFIGTIWFCSSSDLRIGVISGIVTSLSEYVKGDLCFFSNIDLATTSSFVGNRPSEPITVTNDPNLLDPSPVRNQQGASVGSILGDGVSFQLSDNIQPVDWSEDVQGVQLTFTIEQSYFEQNGIPDWYILDFGLEVVDEDFKTQPSDEIELQPVGATIGATVGQPISNFLTKGDSVRLPVRVDGVLLDPFRYNKQARIYPIARLPDWEDEERDEALSTGEAAMIGIFAGLYGVAFFATLLILIKGLHVLTLSLLVLFVYVLATFSFRTAFWAIVASGDFEETSAGYFILVEPPSFFILSVLTVLIMSYAFIVAASNGGSDKLGTYWLVWFLTQVFLIVVLFVVVGLMIGLDNNDDITISCFGRQSTVQENTTIRDIRIAYHSFILFAAIICAFLVIKLGWDLPNDENKSKLQLLSGLAGGAVVLTSLLWVIYSAIDIPSPYFIIPLFFTEVPPLLLMCYLSFPKEKKELHQHEYDL